MSATTPPTRRRPGRPVAAAWWCCVALAGVWAALAGMVLTHVGLAEADAPVLRWFVAHRAGARTGFLEAVSSTPVDGAAAVLGAGVVLVVAVRTRSVRPLLVLGAAVGAAVVLAEVVKVLVGRARPATATMLGTPESGPGFPSAHTLVFTALAGAVALVLWREMRSASARILIVGIAVLTTGAMGVSRLYLGDHWLTDVLASYALAGAVLAAVAALSGAFPQGGDGLHATPGRPAGYRVADRTG
jgi:membrane-associated phospholipid phosphatase